MRATSGKGPFEVSAMLCRQVRSGRRRLGSSRARLVKALLLLTACFLFAKRGSCQATGSIEGRVRTDAGHTIPMGVTLRLENAQGSLVAQQPANSDGQFRFTNLQNAAYRLTATAEGFQPFDREVDLRYSGGRAFVDVFLTPSGKPKTAAPNLPAHTDLSVPRNARKEQEKGVQAIEKGDLPGARTHLEKAVAQDPCFARAQTALGWVLMKTHDLPGAEAALKKSIECDPGFETAYVELAQLLNALERFPESEQILQNAIRRFPGAWQIYYQLAAAHLGLKQYEKAEEEYLKAASLNPHPPPEFHVKLADLYTSTEQYDKAYAEMQAYLRADPQGRFAPKIRAVMQKMESTGVVHSSSPEPHSPPVKP